MQQNLKLKKKNISTELKVYDLQVIFHVKHSVANKNKQKQFHSLCCSLNYLGALFIIITVGRKMP